MARSHAHKDFVFPAINFQGAILNIHIISDDLSDNLDINRQLLVHSSKILTIQQGITRGMGNIGGHVGGHRIQKKIIKMFFPLFAHQKEH